MPSSQAWIKALYSSNQNKRYGSKSKIWIHGFAAGAATDYQGALRTPLYLYDKVHTLAPEAAAPAAAPAAALAAAPGADPAADAGKNHQPETLIRNI